MYLYHLMALHSEVFEHQPRLTDGFTMCTIDLSGLISHHLDPVSKSSNEALTWDFSSHRQVSHFYEIIAEM